MSAASSSGSGVSRFMPATSSGTDRATTKSAPCRRNASTGGAAPGPRARESTWRMLRPVRSGFCSDPERASSFSRIARVRTNQEWSWPVRPQVGQRAERVEPGEQRRRQPAADRVEPQRRRAGQDADAVAGPDRVPVLQPLDVVPHPVAVDQPAAGALGDRQHPAVDVGRDAGDHLPRRASRGAAASCARTSSWSAPMPPEVTTTAWARSSNSPVTSRLVRHTAGLAGRGQDAAADADDGAAVGHQLVDAVAEPHGHLAGLHARHGPGARTAPATPGPVPQVTWKRGTELPCPRARPSPRSAQPTTGKNRTPRSRSQARFSPAAKST